MNTGLTAGCSVDFACPLAFEFVLSCIPWECFSL